LPVDLDFLFFGVLKKKEMKIYSLHKYEIISRISVTYFCKEVDNMRKAPSTNHHAIEVFKESLKVCYQGVVVPSIIQASRKKLYLISAIIITEVGMLTHPSIPKHTRHTLTTSARY
jgi:hypothetical protein